MTKRAYNELIGHSVESVSRVSPEATMLVVEDGSHPLSNAVREALESKGAIVEASSFSRRGNLCGEACMLTNHV